MSFFFFFLNTVFPFPGAVVADGGVALTGVERDLNPNMAFEREEELLVLVQLGKQRPLSFQDLERWDFTVYANETGVYNSPDC